MPALDILRHYYSYDKEYSAVPATEHSVMCAGLQEHELETYRRIITEVHPDGLIAIVGDTWSLVNVLDNIMPKLKEEILARDGCVITRPDSGYPPDILCGSAEWKGVIPSLLDTFGFTLNSKGFKVLNSKVGVIYGEAISVEVQNKIFQRLETMGIATTNVTLGIGSYALQHVTRDTHGIAIKATYCVVDGKSRSLQKAPKTDSGTKKSARGLLMVTGSNGRYELQEDVTEVESNHGALQEVFRDGKLLINPSYEEVLQLASKSIVPQNR